MNWANTNALHWLTPSENEWYKAAYYNALKGTYYTYPFQSNSLPTALHPPGNANSGNFDEINFANGTYFTDVGAYPQSVSPFGLFDIGGNIGQWTDALDVSGLPIWRDTESGTYTITGGGNNSGTVVVPSAAQRVAWASASPIHWLIPSESEWYKAAYYNPAAATYFAFPFQNNSQPAALAPPGTANSGNLSQAAFNSDGLGSDLSDVGAYRTALGPFGSFDMGGDVLQWTDTVSGTSRIVRGSSWAVSPPDAGASTRFLPAAPTAENTVIGFRMVSVGGVPEPGSSVLALIGLAGVISFSIRRLWYRHTLVGMIKMPTERTRFDADYPLGPG
jgi:formylglycine-generating enzyme required for sulfatase activity